MPTAFTFVLLTKEMVHSAGNSCPTGTVLTDKKQTEDFSTEISVKMQINVAVLS